MAVIIIVKEMRFNPKIVVAVFLGLLMVGGSFVWNRSQVRDTDESIVAFKAEENKVPVRGFIPVDDNDEDGLPDWQNSFDIATVYVEEGKEETLTRTGALAVEIATNSYLAGGNPSMMSNLGSTLAQDMLDMEYSVEDITVSSDVSAAALRAYGNEVASIALRNAPPSGTEGELIILNRALLRNDPIVLEKLDPTIASYEKMLAEMLETPVPSSLTKEHLSLINVYQAIISDIKSFRQTFDDALPAMSRFRRYQADAEALYAAIVLLYQKLDQQGIEWNVNDPASRLIKVG